MDILEELESMAQAAWQKLFGYSAVVAEKEIMKHRQDILRFIVPDDHWSIVQDRMESEGYDRESYEHLHSRAKCNTISQHQGITTKQRRRLRASTFLVKLEGPLSDTQVITQVAGLSPASSTEVIAATDLSGRPCSFYKINGMDKIAIEQWLQNYSCPEFTPTFIRDLHASKDLSSTSLYPTLGLDPTMPQYRLSDEIPRPRQDEYPVWYFFYGTLADSSVLARLFGSDFHVKYRAAKLRGGTLRTWGRYNALVDDTSRMNLVFGKAFLVETTEQEERLRAYETNIYEVVRCTSEMDMGEFVNGLTFRFTAYMMD